MIDSEDAARSFVSERCPADAYAKLEQLVGALKDENKNQNLVSRRSLEQVWQRHIADSAQLLDYVPRETGPWLDLGSGAGFPGIVLSIMRPEISFTLVESRRKRVEWLEALTNNLALDNCDIEGVRLELLGSFPVKVITARAFAPLPKLLDLSARFSTEGTTWLLPKGRSAAQEVQELGKNNFAVFHVEQSHTDQTSGIVIGKAAKGRTKR